MTTTCPSNPIITPSSTMTARRRRIPTMISIVAAAALALTSSTPAMVEAFTTPSSLESRTATSRSNNYHDIHTCPFQPRSPPQSQSTRSRSSSPSTTSLNVLGQEGIFGVGAPEIAVTLIVGYFVLGPSDLYKLVKEIGKFIQNFRTLGTEAAKQFEGTMEDQLELTELRKAQAELNDAFNFRRSINTNDVGDAFEKTSFSDNIAAAVEDGAAVAGAGAAAATAVDAAATTETTAPTKKKRRLVRRKKKKAVEEIDVPTEESVAPMIAEEYPDLDMLDVPDLSEEEKLRAERLERLGGGGVGDSAPDASNEPDWFTASEEDIANEVLNNNKDPALASFEKNRFQSQLSADDWNAQIMENEDELAPLSMVMKRLAILEEEKNAADKLLEEEYQRRMDNEDKYYLEKRRVLEEAITDIQEEVYMGKGSKVEEEMDGKSGEKEGVESSNATEFSA
mmetsp:Transcript_21784/g.47408  ORF Transcript_21784/g.47408 Transcript_21784/m.47408 type:complete len:452 (-) Transcript_21784:352-1707(-)